MIFIEHSKPTLGREEKNAVRDVIKSGFLAEGGVVKKFEQELSDYIGVKGAVATSTGTLALHLALATLGLGKGSEVIVPSYTCRSLLNALAYSGASPVVCDVNEHDYNISFAQAKRKISQKTKAIIIPHMFGCPAEVDKFKSLGIFVIEDCAHSIGAQYKGKKLGSWGDLAIFSFEGTKYIIAGEGGMVATNSSVLLNRMRDLKEPDSLTHKIKYTYRMTNLQAAVGREQLIKLETFIKKREAIAKAYSSAFSELGIDLPSEPSYGKHIFHRYMVGLRQDMTTFMERCYRKGVKIKQPVKPLTLHKYLGLSAKHFPNTERIMKSAVSIPIYPSLTMKQVDYIIKVVKGAI